MGLFDSIKRTASDAVNSVKSIGTTGNPTSAQNPEQQATPEPTPQVEQDTHTEVSIEAEKSELVESTIQPEQSTPSETEFLGRPYSGIGGGPLLKSSRFFEDHLQFGSEDIPYSALSEITIVHMASSLTNGTAQVFNKNAKKALTLSFSNGESKLFVMAVDYANERIAEANGNSISKKFSLRSPKGERLDVFEDYVSIKRNGSGLSGIMGQGDSTDIMMIPSITNLDTSSGTQLIISYTNDSGAPAQSVFNYNAEDSDTIKELVDYIQNYVPEAEEENEATWTLVTGTAKEFPVLGEMLTVNEDWDVFNSYRKMYMDCAARYSQQLSNKYRKKIHDFDTFMQFYIPMYKEYLVKIINKTTDLLVSAGVWTETNESIMQRHISAHHMALDDYTAMYNSLQLTVQKNKKTVEAITGLVPNLVGGGFGLKGAAKGIAQATAFNLVRDGAESALIGSMNISGTQKAEIYGQINQEVLLNRAFMDYWNVYLTLIAILNENGKAVWEPSEEDSVKADNIMKNVSNPNFPQDQFPKVMVSVISMNPYKRTIYELLRNRGADENEVTAISEYFGYTDKTPAVVK